MKQCTRCQVIRSDEMFLGKQKSREYTTCTICRETFKKIHYRKLSGEKSDKEIMSDRRKLAIQKGNFVCSACKLELPFSEFRTDVAPTLCVGNNYTCNLCSKLRWRFSKIKSYGLNKESFFKMFNDQGQKCAICKKDLKIADTEKMRATTLCVDHDHITGKGRGILCNNCNRGLGFLGDDKTVLLSAYNYLVAHDKQGELLEKPEEVNQQPSLGSNTFEGSTTNSQVLTKDSNANTSALPKVIERDSEGNPLMSVSFKIFNFGDDIV